MILYSNLKLILNNIASKKTEEAVLDMKNLFVAFLKDFELAYALVSDKKSTTRDVGLKFVNAIFFEFLIDDDTIFFSKEDVEKNTYTQTVFGKTIHILNVDDNLKRVFLDLAVLADEIYSDLSKASENDAGITDDFLSSIQPKIQNFAKVLEELGDYI